MAFSMNTVKENKGMVALLGVLIVACCLVLWWNLKGDSTPPPKPIQVDEVFKTPELKKQYEQHNEIPKKAKPSGA